MPVSMLWNMELRKMPSKSRAAAIALALLGVSIFASAAALFARVSTSVGDRPGVGSVKLPAITSPRYRPGSRRRP